MSTNPGPRVLSLLLATLTCNPIAALSSNAGNRTDLMRSGHQRLGTRWSRTGDARLLYATKTARWADRFKSVVDSLGVFGPDGPPCTPDSELAVALRLNEQYLDLKVDALRAQASQVTVLCEAMGEATYRDWVADEWFRSGASR